MAEQLTVTRMDFTLIDNGRQVVVMKFDDQTVPARAIPVSDPSVKPGADFETMLTWCIDHGWTVRRFAPLGARAWKGTARVVRTAGQIIKKRDELTRYPVPGLNVVSLDLAYDC